MSGRDVCISACQIDPGSFGGCNSSERVEAHPTRPLFTRGHVVKHVTSRASRSFSFPMRAGKREKGLRTYEGFSKSFWWLSIGSIERRIWNYALKCSCLPARLDTCLRGIYFIIEFHYILVTVCAISDHGVIFSSRVSVYFTVVLFHHDITWQLEPTTSIGRRLSPSTSRSTRTKPSGTAASIIHCITITIT